ncbi:MAG: PAS domain S-box protein [Syntrophales bacterium]|jgi:PAS domain S-box-containing protein
MTTKKPAANKHFDDLWMKAENALSGKAASKGETSADVQKLIHELDVHQIELEMQNEALRRSQIETAAEHHKYIDLYDFAPVGYFTLDKKSHIVEANVTGASLLGFEKRSLIGQPFRRFVTPGDFNIFQSHLQKVHASRSKDICKLKLTRKDGSLFDARIDTIAVRDSNGNLDHYRFSVTDVTEITKVEEELQCERDFTDRVLSVAGALVTVLDTEGRIVRFNGACERATGYAFPEVRGRPFWDLFIIPEELQSVKDAFMDLCGGLFPIEHENYWVAKDGSRRFIRWTNTAMIGPSGTVEYVIGTGIDITDRKQTEEILIERTVQLETINKELESFSYSVSHDLRAPLRAIDGYARLILKRQGDKFDQDTIDKFNVIRSSTHLMGQLIDDLLTFSRLGRKQMSLALLDMELLTKDAWKELQAGDPERCIKLTIESMPPCYGDMALIKQVLINLLSNAVKFTKYKDAAEIVVGGYADGNEHVYYIRDNGVGFDMAYYDKLFGVFQRLHSTDQFEGTGVGLATVQRIILRHGGRVWAAGKVHEGACFYFALNMKE